MRSSGERCRRDGAQHANEDDRDHHFDERQTPEAFALGHGGLSDCGGNL
jgi:hypothetical protein